jgi:hypothetical protein
MPNPGVPYLFNYTFLDTFMTKQAVSDKSLDTGLLLRNFSFSSDAEMGLEFVDVLTNAIQRLLRGRLQRDGCTSNSYCLARDRMSSVLLTMRPS